MNNLKTKLINSNNSMEEPATILLNGGLVAFPTETVYGLGANGLDKEAVKKIYLAKNRPSDNPLILHTFSVDNFQLVCKNIPKVAYILAEKFMPGPLTIIMEKKDNVPYETSGNLETVALRIPNSQTALKLLKACNLFVAAPSANSSGKPSPTNANHVLDDLNGKIDMVIDGGSCEYGLESTVLDLTVTPPTILRPGGITKEMLQEIIPDVCYNSPTTFIEGAPKAPGMKYTHYSPKAKVIIVKGKHNNVAEYINNCINVLGKEEIGIMTCNENISLYKDGQILSLGNKNDVKMLGSSLFKTLRQFDDLKVNIVYSECFGEDNGDIPIMNRLNKSSGYTIINV